MAKRGRRPKGNGESISGWFRQVFGQHPEWLKGRSNAAVIERWQQDHPGGTFGDRERNACNNIKSIMRKRLRKRGRKPAAAGAVPAVANAVRVSRGNLEMLEERIDECMGMARALDRE